jgi:hypothetical protein
MKYLLTLYGDETAYVDARPEDIAREMANYESFDRAVAEAGVLVAGEGLQPTPTATTVRIRDGERLLTDGPFAETREQLGGFYLLDCADLDEAIGWAAKLPAAATGAVEVRPVIDYDAVAGAEPGDDAAARS